MSVITVLAAGVLLHYITYDGRKQESGLSRLTGLTGFSSPSLSVAYYEPRLLLHDETINPAYPQMQPIDKMDLVYEK
jgi:hypothetical protein